MKVYIAIGKATGSLDKSLLSVNSNNQIKDLSKKESFVWSMLNWNIFMYSEIVPRYIKFCEDNNYDEFDLDAVLSRLEARNLICVGHGVDLWTSLYDAFKKVVIIPCHSAFLLKIILFIKIFFREKSIRAAMKIFNKDKPLTFDEKVILDISKRARISPAYIVDQLIHYEAETSGKTAEEFESFRLKRLSVLKSTATLFINKHILFDLET